MKTKVLFTLFILGASLFACNSPEADGKKAAEYYCQSKNAKTDKVRSQYQKKMNDIRKKYYKKTGGRMFDKKFEDAFIEGQKACL